MSEMDLEEAPAMADGKAMGSVRSPPLVKTRSLSDGGGAPKLSPSPLIFEAATRQSKDDSTIQDRTRDRDLGRDREATLSAPVFPLPSTPIRTGFPSLKGNLSLHVPPREATSPAHQSPHVKQPAPLSPKLDHSQIYASPTGSNILPRRSRGLDFSRAATSLHHSTLADQASPDSSPTIGSRAMNIPGRRAGDFGIAEQSSNSLWSVMGTQDRVNTMHVSSSLGSNAATTHMTCSSGSSSSDDDDLMDEDTEESFLTTPQGPRLSTSSLQAGVPWMTSPAVNSLMSFQQRQRPRKQHRKRLPRLGPLGLGLGGGSSQPLLSRSPPSHPPAPKEMSGLHHGRRESISWAANQLHISGSESDDNLKSHPEGMESPSRPGVIRRAVTRRGNLLPKTKGFARIRAALMEESAPVDAEVAREAEVIRQVWESDMDLEPRMPPSQSTATTALSSPNLNTQDNPDDVPEDAMIMDSLVGGLGLSSSFKQQAIKNSKGKVFWEHLSENGNGMPPRITPPPPTFPRGSSSGISMDDIAIESPSLSSNQNPFANMMVPTAASSSGPDTPQSILARDGSQSSASGGLPSGGLPSGAFPSLLGGPPSAAEITRRINTKRRRDDDFDPVSFKRRAVSPGMSVHNSPIMQSPMQRDPWGSRPGSVGGDTAGKTVSGSSAPSENGSTGTGTPGTQGNSGRVNSKGRVGFQGMVDTHDGITRLSIE